MINFNLSSLEGKEIEHIVRSVMSGRIAGDQEYSRRAEDMLKCHLGATVSSVKLTTSCTHALEIAAMLLDIKPGDEVIVPSYTFVSTASAFAMRGAEIRFADIRMDTLNLDESRLEGLISRKTKAIVPVHYAGVGCEMEEICAVSESHNIAVVEDNAHGLFGKYRGKPLGTFGRMATQSFHETKNITCGEGGAIVLNELSDVEKCEVIREKGTNRAQFFRGEVDKYGWRELGSSYVISDVLAAFLFAQLEVCESIQIRRQAIWENYHNSLASWAKHNDVRTPTVPEHCEQAYHMYYMLLPDLRTRTAFLSHLKAKGVHAVFHYLPLHRSEYAMRRGWAGEECPNAESASNRIVRLPFYPQLSEMEVRTVIEACQSFSC